MTATRIRRHERALRFFAGCLPILCGTFLLLGREMSGMAETLTKGVELQVTEKRRDATSIQFEYSVANGTAEPVYLLDRPSHDIHGGGMVMDENFAHALFVAPDVVRIVRGILPLPLSYNVARRTPTFLTKVEAGKIGVRSLQIALPLVERRSYVSADEKPTGVKRLVSRVRFELAYTELRPGMKIGQRTFASGTEALLEGRWDPPYQRILTFTFAIAPTELMLHSDPFERAELVK
jgi:hypothetical protein